MKASIICLILLVNLQVVSASVSFDVEGGKVYTQKSKLRIYNDTGTTLDLANDFKQDDQLYYRLRLNYISTPKHAFSLLYAPLKLIYKGTLNQNVRYQDDIFNANDPLEVTYKFNSYRFTYQYIYFKDDKLDFRFGLTAKIRHAAVKLENSQKSSENKNIGFVPLIHLYLMYDIYGGWGVRSNADFLTGKQGRAEDFFIGLNYKVINELDLYAGYRLLEGGADAGEVYTFVYFHYLAFGAIYSF